MKTIRYAALAAALLLSSPALADVILIKKSKAQAQSEEELTLHRYDEQIAKMNAQTSDLSDRILNPEKYRSQDAGKKDNLQVTLIRIR